MKCLLRVSAVALLFLSAGALHAQQPVTQVASASQQLEPGHHEDHR